LPFVSFTLRRLPAHALLPYTTLFRSRWWRGTRRLRCRGTARRFRQSSRPASLRIVFLSVAAVGGGVENRSLKAAAVLVGDGERPFFLAAAATAAFHAFRSEEHTSELQSR